MDLRQLEYVNAVAEELSFTRAAERCHVVQSALSYQVARLEREVGVRLFERTSRAVRLAPGGELLLTRARRILAEVDLARDELSELGGVTIGTLRLGVIGSAGAAAPVVERTLATFHTRHPGVEITIQDTGSAHMAEQVRRGELDLAFVGLFAKQLPDDLGYVELATERLVGLVGAEHPLAARAAVRLDELADSGPFIEMRPESGLRHQVDAAFERSGIRRSIGFELGTSDAVARFVALGFGPAVVPESVAAAQPGTTALRLIGVQARHPVGIVHRRPTPSAPSARAFLAVLHEALRAAHGGSSTART